MITDEQARAVIESMRNAWSGHTPAEVDTPLARARQELSCRKRHDDGPITAELRSILQGLDELAELWGDEAKFRRMRDRLRAVVLRGEPSENPGQLPELSSEERAAMKSLGPDLVRRLRGQLDSI